MLIKSTTSKYKLKASEKKGESLNVKVLVSFFKDNKNVDIYNHQNSKETKQKNNLFYMKSNDKLFSEHYYYKSFEIDKLDKGDQIKSGIIYY